MGNPSATIMPGNHEPLKPQLLHDLNHVAGHGAFGV